MKSQIRSLFRSVGPMSLLALLATHCSAEVGDSLNGDTAEGDPGSAQAPGAQGPAGEERGRGDSASEESVGQVQSALTQQTVCTFVQPHGGSISQQQFPITVGCFAHAGFHRFSATASNSGAGACSIIGWTNPQNLADASVNVSITNAGGFGNGTCTVTITEEANHSVCVSGDRLPNVANACVAAICSTDPACCTQFWSDRCVREVSSICQSLTCTIAPCAHAECTMGRELDATCSPSVTAICARDPFCCTNSWDNICVREVADIAGKNCNNF